MLERKNQPSDDATIATPQNMTQLEGIRQKVFMDRYSLKDANGKPLEFYPEQLWARVARGIAAVEQTEEKREEWEKLFYEALTNFQFVPGGRILAGAGTGHQVTYYNCFSGDTLVHTRQGLIPIGTLDGEHEVLSDGGMYRTACFKSYGKQQLWEVTLSNGATIYATGDHQWVVTKEKGGTERVLTRNLANRRIPINARPAPEYNDDFSEGVRHGITYGDGSIQYGRAHVCLFGEKESLSKWFDSYGQKATGGTIATKEHVRVRMLPIEWKDLPDSSASASYWRGFVAGLIATDGHIDRRGSVMIHNKDKEVLNHISECMAIAGFVQSGITMTREISPYDGENKPVYCLRIFKETINERDILHPLHAENFIQSPRARHSTIRVISVKETDRYEEVFCCVEPETHTITISHGYLTGQCFVIPSPEDSRQGILDNLKVMTEIMARGGGVGINLSTLRPRGSYIKTVNGTASGPCSWAQLYSVATGDVIQQGGCFGPDERIATDHGLIPAKELADRLDSEEAIQAQTHKGLRPFTAVFRNGTKGLYEVTTSHGCHVRVTLDHKMGVLRHGEITTIPLRELEEGSEILLLLGGGTKSEAELGVLPDAIVSITPLGPSQVYDFEVDEVHMLSAGGIYSSNSRRGALMLMLDDTHPDIEEFITVKREAGKIEHANLSICVSDGFMQAVKNDANWDLIWQGEVKKTIRACHLWDLICTSAWESAEPGLVFMDRCNKEANTWYYESIRCVNPCVTGDTLVAIDQERSAIPIKKLAEESKDVSVLCTDLESETRNQHMRLGRFPRLTKKNAEVWKLTLSGGSTFRATPDHKMILSNGDTRQLKDLHSGDVLHSFSSSLTGNTKYKEVVSIEPDGYADVYNITVDDFHTVGYVTEKSERSGIFTLNCGEQPLPFWGVCNLGALNLTSFVKDGSMDWEQLAKVSKIAMRFLDNVIDATEYFISDNQEAQLGTRRTGLGTMGLADALIKMKVPYGSEGSLPIIEHIYATIRDASYEASADIAAEKGPFPKFDRDKYMQGKFIKRLPKPIQEKIEKQGVRNAVLLTQAPTGTTSLLAGVSSGIEPVYDFAMIRRDRTGEHILYHPLLQAWRDEHPDAPTPIYFVSSKDLTPEEHVRVQAMVQRYTDASISKCVVGDTLVSSERGLLPVADLYAGEQPNTFRSLTLHVASLEGTQITSHFYFGGVRSTRRVKLADGHEITGTPNHRLYVGTTEGLMWKRLDELAIGNYVALKIGAQLFGTDVSLCGFQQSTIRSGYQKTIQVPASMNPMLAHFVGSYIAEGCIIHYTVRITNNEGGVLERLREETRLLFGLDGSITPQGRNNALTLQINSKSLCELLYFLGCEGSAAQKTIPWAVLQSSRESMVAFLSGLYLDGFVTDKKVGICLASQKLIQQLQIVFDNFGVQTWISVKHNVQYDRDYYELNAHGQEAQRLLRLLTFDEAHKRERALKLLRREFQGSNSDIIPVEARKSVFADAPRAMRYRHHAYSQALPQEQEGRQLTWFGLRRLANDPEVPLTPSLREIWQESLHFRRVVAVEDSGEQSVYDLSVPTTSAFVGNGIVNHNTVNAPNDHTVEQVQKLYRLAYEMGCKGVTYYRDGSRDAVLTRVEDEKKAAAAQTPAIEMVTSIHQGIKQRPAVVQGYTRQVNAPEGKVNVTINSDEQGPFEVFVNVGKAGSDIAALSEALGRLISLNLQILSPLSPVDRAQEISKQLRGIGGSRSVGFGSQQVRSLPDAVARALELHIEAAQAAGDDAATHNGHTQANNNGQEISASVSFQPLKVTGNLCSQCGCNTMVYEEGCKKCYSCGYSEC